MNSHFGLRQRLLLLTTFAVALVTIECFTLSARHTNGESSWCLHGVDSSSSSSIARSSRSGSSGSSGSSSCYFHRKPVTALNAIPHERVEPLEILQGCEGMKYRRLPNSDLVVSQLGLGTLTFGDQVNAATATELLDAAVKEYAINFVQTSEVYPAPYTPATAGRSERIVGQWLQQNGGGTSAFRDKVVIATSICGYSDEITWCRSESAPTRLVAQQIEEAVDASLERLGVDHIDLLQFQWPERYIPMNGDAEYDWGQQRQASQEASIQAQLETVQNLVTKGKIRSFGLCNETPYGVSRFAATAELLGLSGAQPCSVQNPFNLLERNAFEAGGMSETCAPVNADVAFIAHSPLAGGALTGKYSDLKLASGDARLKKYIGYMYRYISPPARAAVDAYSEIAAEFDLPLGVVSLAWVMGHPAVSSTLLGATSLNQLRTNVQALNLAPLGEEVLSMIDERFWSKHMEPTKGKHVLMDPNTEYTDPAKLPWGAKDEDVDPELDELISKAVPSIGGGGGGAASE